MLGKGIGERYANPAAPATYENVFSCYAEILECRHTHRKRLKVINRHLTLTRASLACQELKSSKASETSPPDFKL